MSIKTFISQKTKILCTMGPAIASEEKLTDLIKCGANAFRLNMSHSSHANHLEYIQLIRKVERDLGVYVPIIADLQGPKIRVSNLPGDGMISLLNGREVVLVDTSVLKKYKPVIPTDMTVVPVEYPTIAKDVKKGDAILFDDGLLKVQVLEANGFFVRVLVVNGGLLKSRKGINLPYVNVRQPAMTKKDKEDLNFAIDNGCDYAAVSFVRTAEDVKQVRKHLDSRDSDMWIIAKIEKPEAVANIEKILAVSDAIMVARGDLGVEIPAAQVPLVQKKIITLCKQYAKPVITATQMLESMIQNPRPTRAEASDVANAVLDGTDAVMLSAETSVGAYPVEAVSYMRMICTETEKGLLHETVKKTTKRRRAEEQTRDQISAAVNSIADSGMISGICVHTYSGTTVRLISKRRPKAPIFAISQVVSAARRVGIFSGVIGLVLEKATTTDETIESIKQMLLDLHCFSPGEKIVITIGHPLRVRTRTNMLSIESL
ncbi:MAG TPA: pyruvate kinase [Patescibacteria group bacterium]|nr:pyruvate kinase [Patescibacteria group bacterium]